MQGLDEQPVQAHNIDGFVFLYSEAQQKRYLSSRKNLLGHERVLEQAMESGYRTLLPLQFGLVIHDWESVREQLTVPKENDLKQLFAKLEGYREVSVKVLWDQSSELEQLMQENAALQAERDRLEGKNLSMDQIVKIGQAIERAIAARKQAIIGAIQETLNPLAIEVIENDPLGEDMIYNTAYLIPWDTEPHFSEQVEALDRQFDSRLRIRYNHLTAPFNFAQLS
ncbi:gas vesicle protein GvpF [Egbenema bharatensis]|uniref:gas vesicle protein GvpF n=1 Tax=Egbenema bharatensis TaxID=3463334 RepID=UPI003A869E5E